MLFTDAGSVIVLSPPLFQHILRYSPESVRNRRMIIVRQLKKASAATLNHYAADHG
jgi:hypothetical protein